jgi:hypothetical protein
MEENKEATKVKETESATTKSSDDVTCHNVHNNIMVPQLG